MRSNRALLLKGLQKRIAYRFRNIHFLTQALTHRSSLHEKNEEGEDNERLEFLGDSVIELAVSHLLLSRFPRMAEGGSPRHGPSLSKRPPLPPLPVAFGWERLCGWAGEKRRQEGGRRIPYWPVASRPWWLPFIWMAGMRRPFG